jgi:hypothetical protein
MDSLPSAYLSLFFDTTIVDLSTAILWRNREHASKTNKYEHTVLIKGNVMLGAVGFGGGSEVYHKLGPRHSSGG